MVAAVAIEVTGIEVREEGVCCLEVGAAAALGGATRSKASAFASQRALIRATQARLNPKP
jgi:hypothetical protein